MATLFLSTPSARRATARLPVLLRTEEISIHALREEGDRGGGTNRWRDFISIHALREEGDPPTKAGDRLARYFYPRPPRGGRPERSAQHDSA